MVRTFWIEPTVFRLNCKFKFYLRAAANRGAAGVDGPASGPDEALPGSVGLRRWVGRVLLFCASPGSRSKTEFIGFAGRRARTGPVPGPLFSDFTFQGSRSKTEFIGFAGRCARTGPAPGPRSDEKRCTEGSRRPPCISSHYYISKRKELTMNAPSSLFHRQF